MPYRYCQHLKGFDIENRNFGKYLVKSEGLNTVVCGPCGETAEMNHQDVREIKAWIWGFPVVDAKDNELPPGSDFRLGS